MKRAMTLRALALIFAVLWGTGCTTTMTNVTPTHAMEPLGVEVSARGTFQAHTNVIGKTIAGGRDVYDVVQDRDSDEPITEEQFRKFIDAGLAWFLFRPGGNFELSARLGLWKLLEGLELGLRYDFTTIKGDLKLQFFESDNEAFAMSLLFGVGRQTVPVPGALEWLSLTEWKRTDFDTQLSFGWRIPDIADIYINPRVMVSRVTIEHKLPDFVRDRLPEEVEQLEEEYGLDTLFEDETMVYWGATVGGMVGYKYVFLALELTAFKLEFEPQIFGSQRKFDSLVLAPTLGLVGRF